MPIKEFYDYDAKYLDEGSELIIPAKLPKAKQKEVQRLAVQAFQAVDCSGLARVDFLMDPRTAKMFVNEINTMPGFTSISMYPKLWAASGIEYPELIDRLIQLGLQRYEEKNRTAMRGKHADVWHAAFARRFGQRVMESMPQATQDVQAQPLIAVRDVRASSRWYQQLLGLDALQEHSHRDVYDRMFSNGQYGSSTSCVGRA